MRGATALGALFALLVWPCSASSAQTFTGLDEALEALSQRQRIAGRISPQIAQDAAEAADDASLADLASLVKIAHCGEADREVAGSLLRRFVDDPEAEGLCVSLSLSLRRGAVLEAVEAIPGWGQALRKVVSANQRHPPSYVLKMLAWYSPAEDLRELLTEWAQETPAPAHLRGFVLELRRSMRPREAVDALLAVELPPACDSALNSALAKLARDPSAGEHLAALFKAGAQSPALVRCLGSVRGRPRADVEEQILARLEREEGEVLAGLLGAAVRLGIEEAVPRVVDVAVTGDPLAKLGALGALPGGVALARRSSQRPAELCGKALGAVRAALRGERGATLAAAISAACVLEMHEDLAPTRLRAWASDPAESVAVRCASIAAFPRYVPFDRRTADILVGLLDHSELSKPAHSALSAMSRVRFPARADIWRRWVARHAFNAALQDMNASRTEERRREQRRAARARQKTKRERERLEEQERKKSGGKRGGGAG